MTATADMHQARPLCMSTGTQHRKRSDFNLACFNYLVSFSLCISATWMHWHTIKTKTHSHWNSLIHLEVVKTSPWPRDLLLGYVRISKAHQHLTWQGLNKVTHTHTHRNYSSYCFHFHTAWWKTVKMFQKCFSYTPHTCPWTIAQTSAEIRHMHY